MGNYITAVMLEDEVDKNDGVTRGCQPITIVSLPLYIVLKLMARYVQDAPHFLHRYRLCFRDINNELHDVQQPLPLQLRDYLMKCSPCSPQDAEKLRPWLEGCLLSWAEVQGSEAT